MKTKTLVTAFLVMVLTSCGLVTKSPDPNFDATSKIAREFSTALLSADAKKAKLLSAPEQWNRVDEWIETHQPIDCKAQDTNTVRDGFISPELSGGSWFTSAQFDEQKGEWLTDIVYDCRIESVNYCFEMNGTRFEVVSDKWQIIGWDAICENNNSSPCSNMCK